MLWTDNYSLGHNTPFLMMIVKNEANGHLAEPRLLSAFFTFLFPIFGITLRHQSSFSKQPENNTK